MSCVLWDAAANDAVDAIDSLAPAEQRAEAIGRVKAYAPAPLRAPAAALLPWPTFSAEPEGPRHRRPEVFAKDEYPPVPARLPRRLLEQRVVPTTSQLQDELVCLTTAIYFEARGESYLGQVGVAQVILNRVTRKGFPKTICGVVYENAHVRNACQFSFACDGIPDAVREPRAWRWAERVARSVVLRSNRIVNLRTATNYHATYVSPGWAHDMRRLIRIGLHVFYQR